VGWFQGQSEFGPRALGGRSILADPRSSTVRDYINSRIKFREDFRPFAPSVLVEDLPKYFDCDYESPFMLLVAPVRQEWAQAIPGVVHRDGTARIHTVTPAPFCPYYNLLRAFKERSGIGILLNTSLNKRSMPIVESPEHAIQFFLTGGLDLLVIDNYLVQKEGSSDTVPPPVSELFCATIRRALERRKAEGQTLSGRYQFKISVNQDWTVDLSSSAPNITQNAADGPHAVIEMSEDALRSMLESSFEAFRFRSDSRLRISGNVQRALDLFRWLTGS
jgi:carbamoyltransferase